MSGALPAIPPGMWLWRHANQYQHGIQHYGNQHQHYSIQPESRYYGNESQYYGNQFQHYGNQHYGNKIQYYGDQHQRVGNKRCRYAAASDKYRRACALAALAVAKPTTVADVVSSRSASASSEPTRGSELAIVQRMLGPPGHIPYRIDSEGTKYYSV